LRRHTLIAHGRHAMRERRLYAARHRQHGLHILTFEQLAARLAGGLTWSVDEETLRHAVQAVLPTLSLGELDPLKSLPGMVAAAVDTISKVWRAGIDLQRRAGGHPRLASIATLEKAILAVLPPAMMRPTDLVAAALARLEYAPTLIGPVELVGLTELALCWRPLLLGLATQVPVRWVAGPRSVPAWLEDCGIQIERAAAQTPQIGTVSASTAYQEAIDAMRWARALLDSGQAKPAEIAIAAVTPVDYDDYFLALRHDANFELNFVHGVHITSCREGQAAAALADILLRGPSQMRMRRLSTLLRAYPGPFQDLPEGWERHLPSDAPLTSHQSWTRLLERLTPASWNDDIDHTPALREIVNLLWQGTAAAAPVGEQLLSGRVLAIWRSALRAGPAASLDLTLAALRQDDGLDACASLAWMPASALAASPRRFVRLLGLNSSRWPRAISEDRLLSDHIIPTAELDPLPVSAADRRDFETILATTECQVALSRARRDADGRLLGRSPLLYGRPAEHYLRRNAAPEHAFSETDRLTARPDEFSTSPQSIAATSCWRDWMRPEITAHDGLLREHHPAIDAALGRVHSASSLRLLLRNPLGFVWQYVLGWRSPTGGEDPLILDALGFGDLVHGALDRALQALEVDGGCSTASGEQIARATDVALHELALDWESERSVPPALIWRRTLEEAGALCERALSFQAQWHAGARSYSEVPFGGSTPKSSAALPWDATLPVEIPGTGLRIGGYIDRLDIAGDSRHVRVRDYKSGRTPSADIVFDGGKELQRCLYAFAAKAMLGEDVDVKSSLLFLRDETDLPLDNPGLRLREIGQYLQSARANLLSGGALLGVDTGGRFDALKFALPANAGATYRRRKEPAAIQRLGDAVRIWEAL
jgi:PD-(D/E)XK nuclease superfamily